MKLLFAIKHLGAVGGAERVLCLICSRLAERGHSVAIATFDGKRTEPYFPIDTRVRRINLPIGNAEQPAGLLETVRRMRALRELVTVERPDVVIAFMHSMFVPMALALAGSGVAVVGSEHIVREHYRARPLQWLAYVAVTPLLRRITVLSRSIMLGFPRQIRRRMTVMPNPVWAQPTQSSDKPGTGYVLLNVGRLNVQKDQATLIKAFSRVADEFPGWTLRIVGDGDLRGALEGLIGHLGMHDRVFMPGNVREIGREYALADLFAISSRYESFGLVTAEAMMHALPVLGFADCPGTNELIEDGVSGILVHPGNDRVDALAGELRRLMSDPARRRQLGTAARERARALCDLNVVCDRWEDLLGEVHA